MVRYTVQLYTHGAYLARPDDGGRRVSGRLALQLNGSALRHLQLGSRYQVINFRRHCERTGANVRMELANV